MRIFVLIATMTISSTALAVPPGAPYGGYLEDPDGEPYTGALDIEATLYAAPSGGQALWGPATIEGASAADGYFDVVIDDAGDPLGAALEGLDAAYFAFRLKPEDASAWIALEGRQRLGTTGYAHEAADAQRLGGLLAAEYVTATELSSTVAPLATIASVDSSVSTLETQLTTLQSTGADTWCKTSCGDDFTVDGALQVVTTTLLQGTLTALAAATFEADLTVEGDTSLDGELVVGGDAAFNGSARFNESVRTEPGLRVGNSIYSAFVGTIPASGSGQSTDPLHIQTGWRCGYTSHMYRLRIHGYNLLSYKPFEFVAVGYSNPNNGSITYHSVTEVFDNPSVSASQYCASEGGGTVHGYLTFKLESSVPWSASDLIIDVLGGGSSFHGVAANSFSVRKYENRATDF